MSPSASGVSVRNAQVSVCLCSRHCSSSRPTACMFLRRMKHYIGNSDPLVCMGDLGDMIAGEFQLREAQEQRRLEEHEYQSIRLELVIGYRQTLADLQTGNRRAEKKAKWRKTIGEMLHMTKGVAPGKVGGQETEEEKISILIDQLNKDILVSTK
ncbi:hypothetical protein NHX12_034021, partial [Muraenolepis orangiensis]